MTTMIPSGADLPIACTLDPAEYARRLDTLLPGLVAKAESAEVLPDGVCWSFRRSDELMLVLAAVIEAERRCCPFLRFQVTGEPSDSPVVLEVTGPPGTRGFLERLVAR
ncbi:MAG TPA: hypothetical protein VM736_12130 [Gemmatimonadales bacterium]|nr:hypothetical protein [Gemmatimonadales bacterium]